ncbi:hypothetical protein [Neobacillus terrae]|uniref:hypothetical protein n=1 Tax=Neobacillus terrae TaxID=3034837 RepID=UPI0014074B24|nr:hypothetical protein [Neobacillus terrae]NHM34049.1 hypothetical protein [Neobacillus terrae]
MSNKKQLGKWAVRAMNLSAFITSSVIAVGGGFLSLSAISSSHVFTGLILFILFLWVGIAFFRIWNRYFKPLLLEGNAEEDEFKKPLKKASSY